MSQSASRVLLDSSAWLAYFFGVGSEIKEYIETEATLLLTSVLSIHEVKKKLLQQASEREARQAIDFMKENSVVLDVNGEIAEKSVLDCIERRLHTIDALIYRTALENDAVVLTGDSDFQGLKNARVLK